MPASWGTPTRLTSLVGKGRTVKRARPAHKGRARDVKLVRTQRCGLCDDAGHAENPYNNRCDELAVMESKKFK